MKNSKNPARKLVIHFEQIPIDVVKTIAEVEVPKAEKAGTRKVPGKRASTISSLKP